jgi:chromosome segregation ATPase
MQATVFKLRELEILGKKAGIVEQTVKDVLQSLVDDNMVNQDKVGSLNVFYSFPSAAMVRLQTEIKDLNEEEKRIQGNVENMEKNIEKLHKTRAQTEKRKREMTEFVQLKKQKKTNEEEILVWEQNDPSVLDKIEQKIKIAKDSANRWTDNLWSIESYLVKKKNQDRNQVKKLLGLTDSFDYVE